MAFTLENYRTHLTTMLSLAGSPEISNTELDRGVNQASAVLSRYFPRELVAQTVYNESVSDESVTLSSGTKALANKPVRFGSEVVERGIYKHEVLASVPAGYWRLNEASGTFADSSANTNIGTGTTVTYAASGLLASEPTDKAVLFDGIGIDVINCGSDSSLDELFISGSIEFLINALSDGLTSSGSIIGKASATNGWLVSTVTESGGAMAIRFSYIFSVTAGIWTTTDLVLTVGQTHHVVITYDNSSVSNNPVFYVDGVSVSVTEGQTPVGTADLDATYDLRIGNDASALATLDATIDEVAVYATILTAAEALSHYTASAANLVYVKDTDYEIDYVNGTLTYLTTGSITISQLLTITYKLDGTMIDISSLLTEPLRIDRVDVVRSDRVPTIYESWSVHGDFLMILTSGQHSQERFVDNDHIRIYYLANQVEPAAGVSGSFPDYLDELVLIGASGYALLIEAAQREHKAVVDLASSRTSIGNIAAIHTTIGTLSTSITTALTTAAASLTSANAEIVLANVELDKVDAAGGPLADIETERLLLVTLLGTGGLINTALAKVDTYSAGVSDSAKAALALVNTELLLGNTALDKVPTELTTAKTYLTDGDAFLNTVNIGRNAGELFQAYSIANSQIASVYANEAQGRFSHGQVLTQQAAQWLQTSQSFVNEANALLRQAEAKLAYIQQVISVARAYQLSADGYNINAQRYTSSALASIEQARVDLGTINAVTQQIQTYINEADIYQRNAQSERASAESFRQDGLSRIREFNTALRDRAQINTHPRASSVRQYSSDMDGRGQLSWERQGTF